MANVILYNDGVQFKKQYSESDSNVPWNHFYLNCWPQGIGSLQFEKKERGRNFHLKKQLSEKEQLRVKLLIQVVCAKGFRLGLEIGSFCSYMLPGLHCFLQC